MKPAAPVIRILLTEMMNCLDSNESAKIAKGFAQAGTAKFYFAQ
jgi:hypothetical protein